MRNATTSAAERQALGEKITSPFKIDSPNLSWVDSFPALRVTSSQCDGVYDGDVHWAIMEDRPCGTILADVDVGPNSLPLATLFASSSDLLTAAELALGEIERHQKLLGVSKDERSDIAFTALHSAIEKARVKL
ncbi:MAG: hypothetical protein JWM11_6832 [Planctomycetaceae bacterium]|nr:hypothetical protein [Planctomycetaceae bacterium]